LIRRSADACISAGEAGTMPEKAVNPRAEPADTTGVSEHTDIPAAPAVHEVVEIVDPDSGARVTAIVERADGGHCVLRFDRAAGVPELAPVRWYHGDTAWQAISHLERIDETSVKCRLAPAHEWELSPGRQALRTPVDNAPLLVKVVSSGLLAKGHYVHALCLDISDSGCRASWPGRAPLVGDAVELAFDLRDWRDEVEPGWVPALVARVVALSFGRQQIGFRFQIADAVQAAHVRAWHQTWLEEHRRRLLDNRAA
jgi:hypothetical protein